MSIIELINFDKDFARSNKNRYLIGIDEVGRGSLAGEVYACAYSWKKNIIPNFKGNIPHSISKLNDSKKLSPEERETIYFELIEMGDFEVGKASVKEIDNLNILNATFLAMQRAFNKLIKKLGGKEITPYVLIDGNKFNPHINSLQIPIIGGDAKSSLIASASIIAKVERDKEMVELSKKKKYKAYFFAENAGYGTKKHRDAIKEYGPSDIHRKLFIRKTLGTKTYTTVS